jgi:hypothetical protein
VSFTTAPLRRGWTVGSGQLIPIMREVIRMLHSRQVKLLRERWRAQRPDIVVSLIPHLNRALYESLQAETPETPFVTLDHRISLTIRRTFGLSRSISISSADRILPSNRPAPLESTRVASGACRA